MKVGNLSILQELLQVRQKLLIKCETYNIPQGGWKKESVLEGKIKCCSSDRWCSTKGQPLAHSAAHYLLTIFLTLALLQESSVMQIIKCYFIVQGLLQVQQKVCKVISVLQGTFEDACARRAQPACEDEMEKFHGSRAWPLTYPEFSAPFPTSHSFHSSPERESAQPQPCSRVGKPPPTPGEFCAPQQESPLHCSKEHAIGFFQLQV